MQELRNLFSLMVGSKRKYVDPSRAVEILKDAFKSSESQQVSLFLQRPAHHSNMFSSCRVRDQRVNAARVFWGATGFKQTWLEPDFRSDILNYHGNHSRHLLVVFVLLFDFLVRNVLAQPWRFSHLCHITKTILAYLILIPLNKTHQLISVYLYGANLLQI